MGKHSVMPTSNNNFRSITTRDWVLDRARALCECLSGLSGIAGGFLLGMIVNALSSPASNLGGLLNWLFFDISSRLLPVLLSWLALVILLFLSVGKWLLSWYTRKRSYDVRLAELYRNNIEPFLQPFQRGRIAWGLGLTIQSCPDLHAGWSVGDVQIEHDTTKYELPSELEKAYREYVDAVFSKKYTEDKTRLMLIENPRAFSDARPLRLRVKETKYSQVQFYHTWIRQESNQRAQHIDEMLKGAIVYPNSLCLHLVIATADGYLLLTQTSHKNDYYPNQWNSSIGEQLDLDDLQGPEGRFALNWVERALWEELGVSSDGFSPENARIMAVFLEGDIANCALAAIVTLRHHRADLEAIIDKHPRTDYEFQDWDLISWKDIPAQLLRPTRLYHPTTGIRLFYAGLFRFGAPGLHRRLMALTG